MDYPESIYIRTFKDRNGVKTEISAEDDPEAQEYVRSDVFNPKWDQIKVAHENLREYMIARRIAQTDLTELQEECLKLCNFVQEQIKKATD